MTHDELFKVFKAFLATIPTTPNFSSCVRASLIAIDQMRQYMTLHGLECVDFTNAIDGMEQVSRDWAREHAPELLLDRSASSVNAGAN